MLVVVAAWAAVLGPVWLRRHDAIYESRSVEKFNAAMRVLARRSSSRPTSGGVDARAVMMPARPGVSAISEVSVSGRAGDTVLPGAARRSAAIYRLRRNLAMLALFDFFTVAIWAGVGSSVVLGLHLIGDIVTVVAVLGLRQAIERETHQHRLEMRRRRVATVMAHEQAIVAETAPRRSSAAPVWHDPMATPAAVAAAAAVTEELLEQEEARPARAKRLPATTLRQSPVIDLTTPQSWREDIDLRNVDEEIRAASMIGDDEDLEGFIARRKRFA